MDKRIVKKKIQYIPEKSNKSIYKTYAIYFTCLALFVLLNVLINENILKVTSSWQSTVFTIIIQLFIMFGIPFLLYALLLKQKPKQIFKTCNYFKPNWQVVLISFTIGIIVFVLNIIISSFFSGLIGVIGYSPRVSGSGEAGYSLWKFLQNVLLVAILPGFCEEFLHRGLVLQGTKHMGFGKAIFISAILFGLMHFNIEQFFCATLIGLLLGFVAVVTKNIWPAIIIHFTNNFLAEYMTFASENDLFGGGFYEFIDKFMEESSTVLVFFTCFLVLLLMMISLIFLVMQIYKYSILRKVEKALNKVYEEDSKLEDNVPIELSSRKNEVIQELLENSTSLNLDPVEMKNPIEIVMPKQKAKYKVSLKDKIFLFGSLTLSILITFFTFVWGLF